MGRLVSVPFWLLVVMVLLAAWAAVERLLLPSVRWVIRRRVNRVLEEINTRTRIRIPAFKLTKREVLIDRLLYDPQVQEAAEAQTRTEEMPREVAMKLVERYAREIVPAFNAYLYFRFGYWLARNIARSLYRVRLGYSDEAALGAISPDSTIVFLINHRSNMDYILVGYLASEKAAISYAVGEWARVWPLQALVRSMGAYFVRRNSRDALYRKVLERYVGMATDGGVTQAVFPEGGLSRDGKLKPPKLGILDYMVRAFDPEGSRDVVFIPVGINYDRVLEDRTFLLELDPEAETAGTLATLRGTAKFVARNLALIASNRWHRFGYACVNFGSPISLARHVTGRRIDPRHLAREERFAYVQELATDLMDAIAGVIPVVPVPLVATALVREPGRGWSELELKAEVLREMEALERRGARVYVPRSDQDYAIAVGLRMLTLRHLVREADGVFTPEPAELPLLTYYANSIGHFGNL